MILRPECPIKRMGDLEAALDRAASGLRARSGIRELRRRKNARVDAGRVRRDGARPSGATALAPRRKSPSVRERKPPRYPSR